MYRLFELGSSGLSPMHDDHFGGCAQQVQVQAYFRAIGRFIAYCIMNVKENVEEEVAVDSRDIYEPIPISPHCFPPLIRNCTYHYLEQLFLRAELCGCEKV